MLGCHHHRLGCLRTIVWTSSFIPCSVSGIPCLVISQPPCQLLLSDPCQSLYASLFGHMFRLYVCFCFCVLYLDYKFCTVHVKKPSLELASNNKEKDNTNQSSSAYAFSLQFKGNNIIHHFMPSYNMSKQLHVRILPAAPCNAIRDPVERTATYAWNVTRTKLQRRCASLQHRSSHADDSGSVLALVVGADPKFSGQTY